ncbi:MAG: site-specific DNA-methyltransferase, partial [Leptospiraceae bacterium]|nr:site-specific DNA-methyltransferase [Leptospiraceae bacterium]
MSTTELSKNQQKFLEVMREILEIDKADLDFGIYRIMNAKRDEIESYLNKELIQQIQNELKDSTDKKRVEEEVFSHLARFFGRYYEGGDFISKRRYKEGTYAIPYEGEEVKLYWANHDQYYIKSSENLLNYTFTLESGTKVTFRVVDAPAESNNTKINDGERELILAEDSLEKGPDGLLIKFAWHIVSKKQKSKREELVQSLKSEILKHNEVKEFKGELSQPAGASSKMSVIEKHLVGFTGRHNFDYFIHKDLGGFLRRELDYYLKTEVMQLDNLNTSDEVEAGKYLSQLRSIKKVGEKIITLLAQLEDFQKKLWLKKKLVYDTQYCFTLDKIDESFYPEIAANDKQREEWVKLYAIDEIKSDVTGKTGYSNKLKVDFLKENPYLMIDTALFDEDFLQRLIASFDNLDEQLGGLLVHGDNFHALNLMQERFRRQIQDIYADPPYNANSSEILYKNA